MSEPGEVGKVILETAAKTAGAVVGKEVGKKTVKIAGDTVKKIGKLSE